MAVNRYLPVPQRKGQSQEVRAASFSGASVKSIMVPRGLRAEE